MNERESHDANRDARRDAAAHPEQTRHHEECIGSYVGALLYDTARRETRIQDKPVRPSTDDDSR